MGKQRQMGRRMALLCAFSLGLSCLLSGCATYDNFVQGFFTKKTEESVRIGIFQPMSGDDKDFGRLETEGIKLAHSLYPEALGKPVELVYSDNKSEVLAAETAAAELVEKRVAVVLGSYGSTLSLVGGDVFLKAKIPAIGITCGNPLITSINEYYFRVCFVDSFQGNSAAKYVHDFLKVDQAVVMKEEDDDYALAMVKMFSDKLTALTEDKTSILDTIEYKKGTTDFSKELDLIAKSKASVVYLPCGADDAVAILKQAKKKDITATFIGTDKWDDKQFLKKGGKAVEGAAFTTLFDTDSSFTEMSDVFLKAYAAEYGKDKEPESAMALGFDSYLIAINAINQAGTALNGEAIRDCLSNTKEFQGATGSITFDDKGDPIKSVAIEAVENGQIVHKYTAEPTWGQ